jgi:hypothetical protein
VTNFDMLLTPFAVSNHVDLKICDTGNDISLTNSFGTKQGSWGGLRTGAASTALYRNQSLVTTGTGTSGTFSANNVYVFAVNSNNVNAAGSFLPDQMSAAFTGGGMTAAQLQQLQSRINAYMTALGINVY